MLKLLSLTALLLSLTSPTSAADTCNDTNGLMTYAYQTAIVDGHNQPKYLVGVIKVESHAGESDSFRVVKQGVGKLVSTFYGVGQLTIGAAKTVMDRFPDLWNGFNTQTEEELKARLILDDKFNVQVASKYLLLMGVNKNPDQGITAYQVGPGAVKSINVKTHAYTAKVKNAACKIG